MDVSSRAVSSDPGTLLEILGEAAGAVRGALETIGEPERRRHGERAGQYHLDLVADAAMCAVLHGAGLPVFSEESGRTGPEAHELLVVADPVDGSTNASLGLPWFATSLCVLDGEGPLVGLVVNQASGVRYDAVRGSGARRDGVALHPSTCERLQAAVVGVSGLPARHPGWAQFRALGAASLDMCAVADGVLDGYRVAGGGTLFNWDYLGALLVCSEAGVVSGELDDRELVIRDGTPRRPVVAATPALLAQLGAAQI